MARIKLPPEERRAEIIAAATKLFMQQGYDDTSVSEIVQAVGVAQGTFYWHFKSKEEVLNAAASTWAEEACLSITTVAGRAELSAIEKFASFEQEVLSLLSLKEPMEHFHRSENKAFHDELSRTVLARLHPFVTGVVAQGVAEGVFSVDSPERAALLALAVFAGLPDDLFEQSAAEIATLMTDVMNFVLRGLGYQSC